MPCYILKCGDTDMVKIGWADRDVEARRRELQCAHHEELTLIRVIDGPRWIEGFMHRRFADRRHRGEWFRFHPDMLSVEIEERIAIEAPPPLTIENADPVLDRIETFLTASPDISATAFGRRAANDPTLVHELRKGRECRKATRARIIEFIEAA